MVLNWRLGIGHESRRIVRGCAGLRQLLRVLLVAHRTIGLTLREIGARMIGNVCDRIMASVSILIGFWIEWRMSLRRDRACQMLAAFAHGYGVCGSRIVCRRAVTIGLPVRKFMIHSGLKAAGPLGFCTLLVAVLRC